MRAWREEQADDICRFIEDARPKIPTKYPGTDYFAAMSPGASIFRHFRYSRFTAAPP
jgi:hypothetical protein